MERAEAEAVYDGGRNGCVALILGLATANERLEERASVLVSHSSVASATHVSDPIEERSTVRRLGCRHRRCPSLASEGSTCASRGGAAASS